ncbi:MAG: sigma 54-interacting transcriptional regulator, partial [candidate division Zixibacteria bacterium]|nr:sigma 54-interacting transcriptional regulator [candidate division Zixibacteria bacterium]
NLKLLTKSLKFGKYVIASPGLLNEFKRISYVHKLPKSDVVKERDYLASFLVIGGQGSGKDPMSGIIQLLYPEYRFGRPYTINMAALKPGFLSVPLMSGAELVMGHPYKGKSVASYEMHLKGIFRKVWEDFLDKYFFAETLKEMTEEERNNEEKKEKHKEKAKNRLKEVRSKGLLPVVILDELNSLDIDAQGSLLRVLQNMQVQSLGSIEEYPSDYPKMDFLVVGVVNEPEESLTLENDLQRLSSHREIIGSLATNMLYEKLRNMRRLREDLYHRLIRDGKIDLKTLADRREDIPILFSFFVKSELPKKVKWFDIWIDIDAYETLMDTRIAWEGNFRQLQSIAKKVVLRAENKNRASLDDILAGGENAKKVFYRIEAEMVETVLKEDYGIMPKHHSSVIC